MLLNRLIVHLSPNTIDVSWLNEDLVLCQMVSLGKIHNEFSCTYIDHCERFLRAPRLVMRSSYALSGAAMCICMLAILSFTAAHMPAALHHV